MLQEFKTFIMRGNVIDLAVGVIIGAAFGKITTSLVDDVIMPPIGTLLGRVDFSSLMVVLATNPEGQVTAALRYGNFINTLLNFVIIALAVFLLIKGLNTLKRKEEEKPAEATTKECPHCISQIDKRASRCPHCTSQVA